MGRLYSPSSELGGGRSTGDGRPHLPSCPPPAPSPAQLDSTVNAIWQAVVAAGQANNTLILATADNGPWAVKCQYSGETAAPGMPFGGATIPYIMVGGSADGATRHDDSTMINGAGNQLSGDDGSKAKWFKLTRKGQQLSAYISKNGYNWEQVASIAQPKMGPEIQVGFMHYSLPCAVPCVHWARFDHLSITDGAE